ncbi:MAG: pseudouridine synthase, partial [Anaerolineaceae bacterium]|nr:pseudouridine synthase [Anaerolineaceae bacterium]
MSYTYLAFFKPYGVLSQFTDREGRKTLKDFIDTPGVYSAGRLDYDSEGLLFLSDDGSFLHRMTDPALHFPKTYLVQVEGIPTEAALIQLMNGVKLGEYQTKPCHAIPIPEPTLPDREKPVTPHAPTAWLRLVLEEGKKRQIRHMTAAVGFPTLRIVRVAIGPIGLG